MLLEPGVYGEEFNSKKGPFGLRCGQMKYDKKMYHNASWYNKLGQKIGWGDLSEDDLLKIRTEIPSKELFIILGEHDSYWNLSPEKKVKLPINYILHKYRCIISNDGIHLRDMSSFSRTFSEDYKEASFKEDCDSIIKITSFPCPCGGTATYFGEALMGWLTCDKCDEFLMGIGIEFIQSIGDRWKNGERGTDNY